MNSRTIVEQDWVTKAGLRAVCLLVHNSHRCGYVEVPEGHPLHGVNYSEETDALDFNPDETVLGKKSPILILTATLHSQGGGVRRSPDTAFDVHGGITFAGGSDDYPVEGSTGWWFGFDCAHAGDGSLDPMQSFNDGPVRSTEYVMEECESLAEQIVTLTKDESSMNATAADEALETFPITPAATEGYQCVVAIGDPFDGISLYGPFSSLGAAEDWADGSSEDWWIVPVISPEEE